MNRVAARRVAITGSSGLIGRALSGALRRAGYDVAPLVRPSSDFAAVPEGDRILWDPDADAVEPGALEGLHGVFHLAGENIAGGRWTEARKRRIRDSRVRGTETLARALAACERPPEVLISASAIGYYAYGDEPRDESHPAGDGFLAEVCRAWEAAAEPARAAGLRVVHPRIAPVLSGEGGLLERLWLPFRLGLGGRIGSGRQMMSWCSLHDLVRALLFALEREAPAGPFNACSPNAVTNAEFTRALARLLHRPAVLPLPVFALRALAGELSEEIAGSRNVVPARLLAWGFEFREPELEAALRAAAEERDAPDSSG